MGMSEERTFQQETVSIETNALRQEWPDSELAQRSR